MIDVTPTASHDTVVIGAGQAGLAASHLLTTAGRDHVVLERGRVAESWRSQRWTTFCLNTPNWANLLPGADLGDRDRDAFADRDALVQMLEVYAATVPVREQTAVTALARSEDDGFRLATSAGAVHARNVVVASGGLSRPRVPSIADDAPADVDMLTAGSYREPGGLAPGAVLVVGSGQSGCQITEDLLAAGRRVYLCASRVGRVPRRYRGRDIFAWLVDIGFFDVGVRALDDPAAVHAAQPQVSGTAGGHTVSLQSLARDGATLLGRAVGFDGATLRLLPTVRACAEFADERATAFRDAIDRHIDEHQLQAPPAAADPNELDMPDLAGSDALDHLDLRSAGVSTIVWCVGFDSDLSWIDDGLLQDGRLEHHDGVTGTPGLYVVGFPWTSHRASGILWGIERDATSVVEHLLTRAA